MPLPAEIVPGSGRLDVTRDFAVSLAGCKDNRVAAAAERLRERWSSRTGLAFSHFARAKQQPALTVECEAAGAQPPELGEDESYTLEVSPRRAVLRAPTSTGVLRGLATLEQLLCSHGDGWFLPAVRIRDEPRFPWRGLMLDVCRHWQPMDVVKRTLDGMAAVKLNVLHLHLSEDQGFRIECRAFPRLHELGSDGKFFTHAEIREIIAYASARGIRVVPEFDMPGHATSWLAGHPELGSAPGPYAIERKWGIFEPVLDPTSEETYRFLDKLLGEMATLFPDPCFHIGGDEVLGHDWDRNPRIVAFMNAHGLQGHTALQAFFNRRVQKILARHGKRMVGWDEIFHDDLPKNVVIQSWRGPESLAAAARAGYAGILSNGFYIDLNQPTAPHYLNDPLPAGTDLTASQRKLILGGEATMWSEWVTPETVDSRIWPRTAAIAERLWSPQNVRDLDDMYRRLAIISERLSEIGLTHETYIDPLLRRLGGREAGNAKNLRVIADLVEPVQGYERGRQQPDANQLQPLDGLVDAARADSTPGRIFAKNVNHALFDADSKALANVVKSLHEWKSAAAALQSAKTKRVRDLGPLFERIEDACAVGLDATAGLNRPVPENFRSENFRRLDAAARPFDACQLPIIPALRLLVAAASEKPGALSPEAWRRRVESLAAPTR